MKKLIHTYLNSLTNKDYTTLYIHIPYCLQKCKYCCYESHILKRQSDIDYYIEDLANEIIELDMGRPLIKSIYIGGGTASILTVNQMWNLFDIIEHFFKIEEGKNQFTLECHPSTLTNEKLDFLYASFINRISLGIQTFSPQILAVENRPSPPLEEVKSIIKTIKNKFIKKQNFLLNVDLMAGLTQQPLNILLEDFRLLHDLQVPKITVYPRRRDNAHDELNEHMLIENKDKYIRDLISIPEMSDYDFEDIDGYIFDGDLYMNESFYQFVDKHHVFEFDHIYADKPECIDGEINSNIGIGDFAYSWFRTDDMVKYLNNEYVPIKQFYAEREGIKKNLIGYPIEGLRKRINS